MNNSLTPPTSRLRHQAKFGKGHFGDKLYVITNGTITITKYIGSDYVLTIPSTINGLAVTGIGFEAFGGCTNLASVTIPRGVTSIGDYVFISCTNLTTITVDTNNPAYSSLEGVLFDKSQTTLVEFPEGRAGSYTIPDSVTYIRDSAFLECMGLTAVTIGNSVTSIGEAAFNDCTALTSVTIPDSVTSIGVCAFCVCPSLTNVTIPDSITYMGSGAFEYCGLTSVTIGHSLTNIADAAFGECTSLTSVTIPNTVTSIGGQAFDDCRSLTNVTIPNSVASLGYGAFEYCPSLTSITLPNSVTSIGDEAFYECPNLTAVYCWGNAPAIGLDVFDANNNATVFYLAGTSGWGPTLGGRPAVMWNPAGGVYIIRQPQGVATNVGSSVSFSVLASGTAPLSYQWWKGTTNLTGAKNITFTITNVQPADAGHYTVVVTDLGGSTTSLVAILDVYAMPPGGFLYTPNANGTVTITGYTGPGGAVNIPDRINGLPVMSIGDDAFYNCTSLTSVTIPESVTSIGEDSFSDCFSLTSVTLPNRITSIGRQAFFSCSSLTSVTIPDSVTRIGDEAFDDCTSLANIMIPGNVTSIGGWAFGGCARLTGVYFLGNAPTLSDSYVFYNDNHVTVYYLPGTTGWGTTYGGLPTAVWWIPPAIQTPPQTQTAESGSAVCLWVEASGPLPFCLWYFNHTNLISCGTNCVLQLTNVQFSQSGSYTVIVTNAVGAVTSSPAILQVITPVEHRPVPGVQVTGQAGSLLNVDYANALTAAPNWATLGSVSVTSTSQYCFDLTIPLPPHQYYRARQTGTPGVRPSLSLPGMVPAITLTGNMGGSVRVDAINQFGPTDAWVTLATVTLTNTSQLYFDTSAWRQPQRLYRLVPFP